MSGRIRSIKPEILEDEVAVGLSDRAWRLWVSSWLLADDHGNLRAHDRYLAANVWQDTSAPVANARKELISSGRWEPYAVRGQRYVHIRNWGKHQRQERLAKPRVPVPSDDDGTWTQSVSVDLATQSRKVAEESDSLLQVSPQVHETTSRTTSSQGLTGFSAGLFREDPQSSENCFPRACAPRPDHRPPTTDPDRTGRLAADPQPSGPPPAEGGRAKSPRGSRIAPDWTPDPDLLAWARSEGIRDPLEPLAEFRDYWLGVSGAKGTKLDWPATYRNWLRRLVDVGRLEKGPPLPVLPPLEPEPTDIAPPTDEERAVMQAAIAALNAPPRMLAEVREQDAARGRDVRWSRNGGAR